MSRIAEFAKGTADVVKLLALIVSAIGLVGGGVHFITWLANRADATEMRAGFSSDRARMDVDEAKAANEQEWRRAMWEQEKATAQRVGAPTVPAPAIVAIPAPVISTTPTVGKGDAGR